MGLKSMETKVFSAKMHVECKTLFIGDICYALNEEKYDGIWGKKMGYQDGVIADDEATYAIAVGTAFGDGYYYDEKGYGYGVDAGVLGVTNMDFCRENDSTIYGKLLFLPCTDIYVTVSYDDGDITITVYDCENCEIFKRTIQTGYEKKGE